MVFECVNVLLIVLICGDSFGVVACLRFSCGFNCLLFGFGSCSYLVVFFGFRLLCCRALFGFCI